MNRISRSGDSQKAETRDKKIQPTLTNGRDLSALALQYLEKSKSSATKRAYASDWKAFSAWAVALDLSPLPASGATVANYIAHLAASGRAPSTISRALASISQAHKLLDIDSPTKLPEVVNVNKGIRRDKGIAQKRAKPLLLADLKKVCDKIEPSFLGKRDRALILIGWVGALRRSEVVALDLDNIDFVDQGLILEISRSKTDQEGASYKIGIPFASDKKYCPVEHLKRWIKLTGIKSGPLFLSGGTPGKQFFIDLEGSRRLSAAMVSTIVKKRVNRAGLNPAGFSGHSLRAGLITSAAQKKIPEFLLKSHTRHRSSEVLRSYMRSVDLFDENTLNLLL